jgi:hypothetical protein
MATLNTDVSIVDYLKSTKADSSFASRSKLAVEQGIVKSADQYLGTAAQNTSLLTKLKGSTNAGGVAQATAFINSGQDATIKAETDAKEGAPTRTVADKYTDAYSSLADIFMKDGDKPEAVSMADTYTKLRKDMNLDDLEGAVNDLQSQQDLLTEQQRIRSAAERDKPVAMNVIEGRIGEEERQTMERMNSIVLQKEAAVRQLQSANATIENMMQFTKMDYDTARNSYNDQFSQQMQLFGMTKSLVDSADQDEQEKKDAARANLNIIYGSIKDGGMDAKAITPTMQYEIQKMELEAGLPTGFYANIAKTNPDSKVISSTTRESGGSKYADVIMQNPDGSLMVKQIALGASETSSSASNSEEKEIKSFQSDAADFIVKLESKEIGWGAAFNALKAKYPSASNELIDQTLNKTQYYTTEREDSMY